MAVMKLMTTIKREKNVFSAGMMQDIKDNLLKRLKKDDPDFKNIRNNSEDLDTSAKNKLKILNADALAICTEAGIPSNETNKYKGWILSLIGVENSGVGFNVLNERLEDRTALIDNLTKYHQSKGQEGVPTDIFTIKSLGGLIEAVKDYEVSDSDKIKKEKWKAFFKNGEELPGATVLFKNGTYSVYHVEGTHADERAIHGFFEIDALIKMSGKDPKEVKDNGQSATRLFSGCSWCTADPEHARQYLLNNISLTMFYENGAPLYELLGAKKKSKQWSLGSGEFHNASNGNIPLTELAQLIRTMGMPKEKREKIWKALIIKPVIANDIIDNPEKHAKAEKNPSS